MSIYVIGLNHKTAPLDIREQLAFSREGTATALLLFRNRFPQSEAAIISTCNRVEIIVATDAASPTAEDVVRFIAEARELPIGAFRGYLYELRDEQAVRHLFRVASGLDSMVIGECQIVNQVKQAYATASEQGTTGRLLNRLFHHAFSVSKRVRTETEVGRWKVSIPSVAVDAAQAVFSTFSDKRVLVIGAGEMAQLVCQNLRKADARSFTVASRTHLNARALAQACEGEAVPWDELDAQLARADIVIAATSCPKPILTVDRVRRAQEARRGRFLLLIDLAVPRNVDVAVEKLGQVYVYDVDALGRTVSENQKHRAAELTRCEAILDQEIGEFEQWVQQHRAQPMIEQMYEDAGVLCELELSRLFTASPELSRDQREAIAQMAERLANKLMHPSVKTLREHCARVCERSDLIAKSLHEVTVKQKQLKK